MAKKNKKPGSAKWDKKIAAEKKKQALEQQQKQVQLAEEMKAQAEQWASLNQAKSSATGIMQVMHPPMQQIPHNYHNIIGPKQTGKSWLHATLLNDIYGKAGQVGAYTGEDAKQHKWLTWMKQQMTKLHPYVMKAEIYKDEPWHSIRFEVMLTHQGMNQKVSQTVTSELMHDVWQGGDEEKLGHKILQDLKASIEKVASPVSKGAPGNMTIVPVEGMDPEKMFIVPKDMHKGFSEYANSLQGGFKTLAAKWLENHQPPLKPAPIPPDEDKEYKLSPVEAYNMALYKIEEHAKTVNPKNIWGSIEADYLSYTKEMAALAKKKQAEGFRGHVVQDSLKEVLPCLYQQVKCPDHGCDYGTDMANMIIHLNDGHLWSREAIADWAESLDIDISVKETK